MSRKKKTMIGVDPLAWLTEQANESTNDAPLEDVSLADESESSESDNPDSALLNLNKIQDISKSIALKNVIVTMINASDVLTINGKDVERIDGSALQILSALFVYAKQKNLTIIWSEPSEALKKSASILGVDELLELK